MAVRLSLALKVLFATVAPTLFTGTCTIMTSDHYSIKRESIPSIFTLYLYFSADHSQMTATHNSSKPAQIWMKSTLRGYVPCVMTSCVNCWRRAPHRRCALPPQDGDKSLHNVVRFQQVVASLQGPQFFIMVCCSCTRDCIIHERSPPYRFNPNSQGKLHCKVEFSDLLQGASATHTLRTACIILGLGIIHGTTREHFSQEKPFILQNPWGIISFKIITVRRQKHYIAFFLRHRIYNKKSI